MWLHNSSFTLVTNKKSQSAGQIHLNNKNGSTYLWLEW